MHRGWSAATLEEIARTAGVTKGALYHHFTDKAALLRALYEGQEQLVVERLVGVVAGIDDPLEALRTGCHEFLRACQDPVFRRVVLVEAPAVLGWAEWRALDARYGFGLLHAAVDAAVAAGRLQPLPTEQLSHLLLAARMEAALLSAREDGDATDAIETFDALLNGVSR